MAPTDQIPSTSHVEIKCDVFGRQMNCYKMKRQLEIMAPGHEGAQIKGLSARVGDSINDESAVTLDYWSATIMVRHHI